MTRRRRRFRQIDPKSLREIVPAVLKGLSPKSKGLEEIRRVWEAAVGAATAVRTRLTGLERGILTVEVASSALKHDLSTFRKDAVLDALRERAPGVELRGLKCRVGTPR